jgi:hypothetical protein
MPKLLSFLLLFEARKFIMEFSPQPREHNTVKSLLNEKLHLYDLVSFDKGAHTAVHITENI